MNPTIDRHDRTPQVRGPPVSSHSRPLELLDRLLKKHSRPSELSNPALFKHSRIRQAQNCEIRRAQSGRTGTLGGIAPATIGPSGLVTRWRSQA